VLREVARQGLGLAQITWQAYYVSLLADRGDEERRRRQRHAVAHSMQRSVQRSISMARHLFRLLLNLTAQHLQGMLLRPHIHAQLQLELLQLSLHSPYAAVVLLD
jgi:hypothetical protein